VLAVGFAIQGAAVVSAALLVRRLDFRRQFYIDTVSYVVGYGGVAIALALLGHGVWSLVWGSLAQTALSAGAKLSSVRHRMRPMLGAPELRDLLHFGLGSSAIAIVNYVALNGDNFVVGRWSGAASLGLYTRAYTLMNLPYTYASSVVSSVLFPAFAEAQGEPARVRRAYLALTRLTAMIAASAMVTMGIVAPHLVRSVYGPRWVSAVLPLQILCLAGYFRALYHLGGIVAQSLGRIYGELWRQIVYAGLVIAGAFLGLRYGLPGVAAGVGLAILYMFVATSQLSLGATHTTWAEYFDVQRLALVTAALTGGAALGIRLLLESHGASSAVITSSILAGAAVPWIAGMLWTLGDPAYDAIRARLPLWCGRLSIQLRARTTASQAV
jgi:PST family polysaccharide transporter